MDTAVASPALTVAVSITCTVDPGWIEFCSQTTDLFLTDHCGYWLRGVDRDDALGWLACEDEDNEKRPDEQAAIAAWRAGKPLPEGWHKLDRDFAARSWGEAVKRFGVDWFEDADADTYDWAIQQTLLGEQRYA